EPPGVAAARHAFFVLGTTGLVVAALYWGQRIFVPLALAVLLTLLLGPVVSQLERRRLGRRAAGLSVACLALLLIGLAGWAVASQMVRLIDDLPRHRSSVREKVAHLPGSGKPGLLRTVQDFLEEFEKAGGPDDAAASARPVVRMEPPKPSLF